MHQIVGDFDGFIGMEGGVLMLVHLGEQRADLHVSLALVLEHLELQRWLCRVVEKFLDRLLRKVAQAFDQTVCALVKMAQLLIAKGHVVHHQEEDKLVVRVLLGLNLVKHRLSFLEEDQCLFEAFLRDEVDCAFSELIDNHGHLVCQALNYQLPLPSSRSKSLL